ncbi:uncharacterized protein, partial [Atheta coriaria]|uniref:uncharacterized protein n=1 Tax=Dalotia coriaria TaxID=877792 RepID=UPI0031F43B98
ACRRPDGPGAALRQPHVPRNTQNTWLKKINKGCGDSKRAKKEHVWVVFCVHDDTEAYLETYFDNKSAVLHKPLWYTSLNDAQHVSPTICAQDQDYEFVITLSSEVVRLAAPSWEAMLDWVESLRIKLEELKILTPKENLYSKPPESKATPLLPTRDPTSPLPPPPEVPPAFLPGVEPVSSNHNVIIARRDILHRTTSNSSNSSSSRSPNIMTSDSVSSATSAEENNENVVANVFNFENLSAELLAEQHHNLAQSVAVAAGVDNVNRYEQIFQLSQSPGPSNLQYITQTQSQSQSGRARHINQQIQQLQNGQPPEPYLTLREHQVMQLQKEIEHPGGVRLRLRKKDCTNCIAFVDAFNSVWVCGLKLKENPMLYNVLHIGDQLLTIEGCKTRSTADVQKILRASQNLHVQIVVNRVPRGQVFVIHRDVEGQPLGILQEGSTAVIADVVKDGLAARHGLTPRAPACEGAPDATTNWVLTEINGRPLNLFYKDNQVKDRLNAVGRDISILVQPLDLVKQIKKQLKTLKNYKDYLLH